MADTAGTWTDANGKVYKVNEARVVDGALTLRLEPIIPDVIHLEITEVHDRG